MGQTKELFMEIRQIQADAEEGNISNLEAFLELKELGDAIDCAKKAISDNAYSDAEKYGQKTFEAYGKKISLGSKTTWDFKHIPAWNDEKKKLSDIEESAKIAALNASKNIEAFKSDSGEQIIPAVAKYSKFLKIE